MGTRFFDTIIDAHCCLCNHALTCIHTYHCAHQQWFKTCDQFRPTCLQSHCLVQQFFKRDSKCVCVCVGDQLATAFIIIINLDVWNDGSDAPVGQARRRIIGESHFMTKLWACSSLSQTFITTFATWSDRQTDRSMNAENRPLVTDESVEFEEKTGVEVHQDDFHQEDHRLF